MGRKKPLEFDSEPARIICSRRACARARGRRRADGDDGDRLEVHQLFRNVGQRVGEPHLMEIDVAA